MAWVGLRLISSECGWFVDWLFLFLLLVRIDLVSNLSLLCVFVFRVVCSIEAPQSTSAVVSPENSVDGVPPLPEPTVVSATTAAPAFQAPGANLEDELRKFQAAMGTNFNFLPAQGGQQQYATCGED